MTLRVLALFLLLWGSLQAGQISETPTLSLWHEEFGDADKPALLLVMGGCCQGTMWHDELCLALAEEGFYVIRYDHRDSGASSCFEFEQDPYNLSDLATDAVDLLNILDIDAAHVAGLSMGGAVAQLMAIEHPGRVLSLTLISTSPDFEPLCRSLNAQELDPDALPGGEPAYLAAMEQFTAVLPEDQQAMLELRMDAWRSLNGAGQPFDEQMQRALQQRFLERCAHPESVTNHILAQQLSLEVIRQAPAQIEVPSVVLHGSVDPVFPLPHGFALSDKIAGAELTIVPGMGHVPRLALDPIYIEAIKRASSVDILAARCASEWLEAIELRISAFERDAKQLDPFRKALRFVRMLNGLTSASETFELSPDELERFEANMDYITLLEAQVLLPIVQANAELLHMLKVSV